MIQIKENHKIPLDKFDNYYQLYTYESIILAPQATKTYILPYFLLEHDKYHYDKFINFSLNKELAVEGLDILWQNLNEKSSEENLIFTIFNRNLPQEKDIFSSVLGDSKVIKVRPNTPFGKIFF